MSPDHHPSQANIPDPPRGWGRLAWLGPGFLWMVSAAGSGELLFTPRIAALYGYSLLWALLAAVLLKWFINREIGRFAVCTGKNVLEGFAELPGPWMWAVWLILLPQAVVAVTTIAGLASSAATAVVLLVPGPLWLWSIVLIAAAAALNLWGQYSVIQWAATILGLLLAVAAAVSAIAVGPDVAALAAGLMPQVAADVSYQEVLPWLGFMLSGAAGLMWYSYWLKAKGYGAGGAGHSVDPQRLGREDKERLRRWLNQMTLDNSIAVVGVLVIVIAFLILGTELLRPEGLVPQEDKVAKTLGRLLGDVWGPIGFWFMAVGLLIGFWGTVLSDQDGWTRMFAGGTSLILRRLGLKGDWVDPQRWKIPFLLVLVAILPLALYVIIGKPVTLLQIAGAIEAAHIPVVAGLVLLLNRWQLPSELKPGWGATGVTLLAALFFAGFAVIYLIQLFRQ